MSGPATVFVATCDLAAQTRGRSGPMTRHDAILANGVGWVPANLALNGFGTIADDNVFGAAGDLRLRPDPATALDLPASADRPGVRLYLADQTLPDGTAWPCCPRTLLARTLDRLRTEHGLVVSAAFEHEFMLAGGAPTAPFSFRRHRDAEPFGTGLLTLLDDIGLEPETWLPEYGEGQYELTLRPSDGLTAADRAIAFREVVRDVADRHGRPVTFAPLADPDGTGNGVHVHLSLHTTDGVHALYDPAGPGRLSSLGTRFAGGIVRHAGALMALTAPSAVSPLRLAPHRWSTAGAFVAEHHREALLRICPTSRPDPHAGEEFNLEYRAADATANPWLVLAAILHAGLAGIGEEAAPPAVWPSSVGEDELAAMPPLPATLEAALDALAADATVRAALPPDLHHTYQAMKRSELAELAGLDDRERCRRIADVY